jgi:hypothetical protein
MGITPVAKARSRSSGNQIKRNSNQDKNQKGGPEARRFLKHHLVGCPGRAELHPGDRSYFFFDFLAFFAFFAFFAFLAIASSFELMD